eukprot:CAMPEP_0198285566 /NCGR_PEP_ID=MMETSP1449-20131203/4823_1 /TAXON_ID=420275 /ORGANISM="Attheya septentrionalis, Strain CCMP2084" /LENGTH=404 /DNA_ID=CAMNT_0043983023 /DNA_START=102 /DNA_END=1316 /DNA_ORIENTATION=+
MSSKTPTSPIIIARSISEVDVTVNPSSPALLTCVGCGKVHVHGVSDKPTKRCSKCQSANYCGRECQLKDWEDGGHKKRCKAIAKATAKLRPRAEELHHVRVTLREEPEQLWINMFDPEEEIIGRFWEIPQTKDYFRQRFILFDALMDEADHRAFLTWSDEWSEDGRPVINRLALELGLEHSLDLLCLNSGDNQGLRFFVPSIMIELGKYQQAYDFMKYWFLEASAEAPNCFHWKGEDVSEPLENMKLNECFFSNAGLVLDLALVKFNIYQAVRELQTLNNGMEHGSDIISSIFTGMLDMPRECIGLNANHILNQTKQLLSIVHHLNKFILPNLAQPQRLMDMKVEYGTPGSIEEASNVMKQSAVVSWKLNKFANQFLKNFIANIDSELLPVPEYMPIPRLKSSK